jgi:hypothetical protein
MNNVIRFPNRRAETCPACEDWPSDWRERLLNGDIPFRGAVCDDCLLLLWEHLMASEPTPRRR